MTARDWLELAGTIVVGGFAAGSVAIAFVVLLLDALGRIDHGDR